MLIRMLCRTRIIITALALLLVAPIVNAQTPEFTYQGRLTDGGSPASATYDMQFKLFDTPDVGTGTPQGQNTRLVQVTSGVFTVQLNFGQNQLNGSPRYLEIGIRPPGSPDPYTVLAPRQPITSTPYSIRTLSATQADVALDANKLGGVNASEYVTTTSAGNTFIKNATTKQTTANFNIDGNGTIGSLNANGAVSLGGSSPPATAPAGQGRIYFDASSNKVRVSENGAAFVDLVGSSGVSGTGTTNSIPLWSAGATLGNSVITQSAAGVQLPNNIQLAPGAQGNQVQFGSPNGQTGMTISGASGRADLRFDGTLRLLNGPGGIPPETNGIAITSDGNVGIGTIPFLGKLHVKGSSSVPAIYGDSLYRGVWGKSLGGDGVGVTGEGFLTGVYGSAFSSSGIGVTGVSNAIDAKGVYGTSTDGIGVHGKSTNGPGVTGEGAQGVAGFSSLAYGVFGRSTGSNGSGVYGESTDSYGKGVYGRNFGGGWGGYFQGRVFVTGGDLVVGTNAGGGSGTATLYNGQIVADEIIERSDRNIKANFSAVDTRALLQRLATIPIQSWNYKSRPESVRHIGPMAQDFHAAFGLGIDDKHIATVDADGVALAAIQGLYQMMLDKNKQIEQLQNQVKQLKRVLKQRTVRRINRRSE